MIAIGFSGGLLCHLLDVQVVECLDQFDVARIEPKTSAPNESVNRLDGDRVRTAHAVRRSAPQPAPCFPDIGQRGRERRACQLAFKLGGNVQPVLANGALQTAFQPIPPRAALFISIQDESALSEADQSVAERGVKLRSSPRNSSA